MGDLLFSTGRRGKRTDGETACPALLWDSRHPAAPIFSALAAHEGSDIRASAFINASTVCTGGSDGDLCTWDLRALGGGPLATRNIGGETSVRCVEPDAVRPNLVWYGTSDNNICAWTCDPVNDEVADDQLATPFRGLGGAACIRSTPYGLLFNSPRVGSEGRVTMVLDPESDGTIGAFPTSPSDSSRTAMPTGIDCSEDGSYVAVSWSDRTVQCVDILH
jgi:WD40 repeat protein